MEKTSSECWRVEKMCKFGYLSPLNTFKVWRIEDIEEEKHILAMIDEMLLYIEKYVERFSDLVDQGL